MASLTYLALQLAGLQDMWALCIFSAMGTLQQAGQASFYDD